MISNLTTPPLMTLTGSGLLLQQPRHRLPAVRDAEGVLLRTRRPSGCPLLLSLLHAPLT